MQTLSPTPIYASSDERAMVAPLELLPHLSAVGLSVTSEYGDEGQNLYSDASQDCLIVDEKAPRRGGIDSEGAGVELCGKSTADSRRVGA